MEVLIIERTEKEFDEYLIENYDSISICGIQFSPDEVLKSDEAAYNGEFSNWSDGQESYGCPVCEKEFDSEDEADECCRIYECEECGEYHHSQDEADECCIDEGEEIDVDELTGEFNQGTEL